LKSLRHESVRLTSYRGQGSSRATGMHRSAQPHATRGGYSLVTASSKLMSLTCLIVVQDLKFSQQ
jgi:hypothetical protein